MTVAEAIRAAAERLAAASETARLDAELLMAHALGVTRSDMLVRHQAASVPPAFAALVRRRLAAEPIAYILGLCEFFGLELAVTPAVLIPRSDSECVVEAALEVCTARGRVLDLGTGSGALLLAMLSQRPGMSGLGIDASPAALAVAQANGERLGLSARAAFLERDWTTAGWTAGLGAFACVIANPPYVESAAVLDRSVRDYEPAAALFAGEDGLDAYRILIPQLPGLLAPGGRAVLEIGHTQAESVAELAEVAGFAVMVRHDLANRPRALILC